MLLECAHGPEKNAAIQDWTGGAHRSDNRSAPILLRPVLDNTRTPESPASRDHDATDGMEWKIAAKKRRNSSSSATQRHRIRHTSYTVLHAAGHYGPGGKSQVLWGYVPAAAVSCWASRRKIKATVTQFNANQLLVLYMLNAAEDIWEV